MKKTITIIRHAESKFNSGEYSDSELKNCKLSENGKLMANKIDFTFDILYISPLKRAIETYTNSNIKTKDISITHLVREHISWKVNMLDFEDESVIETKEHLQKRINETINFLKNDKNKNIGIISHHDYISELTDMLFGQKYTLPNCGYIQLNME